MKTKKQERKTNSSIFKKTNHIFNIRLVILINLDEMGIYKRKLNGFKSEFTKPAISTVYRPYTMDKENVYTTKMPSCPLTHTSLTTQPSADPYRSKRRVTYLGVVRADPNDYVQRYGKSLINSDNLPDFVKNIPTPPNLELVYFLFFSFFCNS